MRVMMALAVAGALAGGARAQFGDVQKPVSFGIRGGVHMPKNKDNGKNWTAVGLDARVNMGALPIIGGQEVAVDYLGKGKDNRVIGITLVQRYSTPAVVSGQPKPYFGMGFGIYDVRWKTTTPAEATAKVGGAPASGDITTIEKKTSAGIKALAGIELKGGLYIQGDYHYPLSGIAKEARGLTFTAGMRF
jgi:hypothetical protein